MSRDITIFVDCIRDGELIRRYDFLCPASLAGPPLPPVDRKLIEDAKMQLCNEHLSAPPFAGLKFVIRR